MKDCKHRDTCPHLIEEQERTKYYKERSEIAIKELKDIQFWVGIVKASVGGK